jgi:hypothetical protein
VIDRNRLEGSVDFVGENGRRFSDEGARILTLAPRDLAPHQAAGGLKLWAMLQHVSAARGGGCVYDADAVLPRCASDGAKGGCARYVRVREPGSRR